MSSLTKIDDNWIPLQTKVFSRWVSSHLRHPNDQKVTDVTKDLSNGVALVELATELTQKQPPRQWSDQPRRNVDMVQNCDLGIDMFTKDGVKLVGISGKDIYDNNQKLILGLVWTLILYYSIGKSVNHSNPIKSNAKENLGENSPRKIVEKEDHVKRELMEWAIDRTSNYPNIRNFHPFDLSLCALLDSYFPEKINYYALNPNNVRHNSRLAIDVMGEIGIPIYVFPDELEKFNEDIDEKTLLTQLSAAKVVLDQLPTKNSDIDRDVLFDEKQDFDSDSNSESDVEHLSKVLEETRADLLRSDEEKMKLTQALAQAKAEINNQKQANQNHESEINKLNQYKESQKNLQAENKHLREALSDKEMELRSEKWEKSKVESEVNELSQTINEMKQKTDSKKEDKAKANAEVEKLLKAASVDAENSRKNLEKELKEVKAARDKAESQNLSLTKQINSFKNEKELFAKSLRDVQEEKESAEKEVSRLTKLVKSSTKPVGDVDKQKQLEKELNDARASKEKLEAQISALSKQNEDFKHEKELFAKSLRDIQEEKESAEKEVSRLTKLAKASSKPVRDTENQKQLEKELNESRLSKEKLEAQISALSKQIEDFKNEKENFAKSLRNVQEEKEAAEREVSRLTKLVKTSSKSSGDADKQRKLEKELIEVKAARDKAESEIFTLAKQINSFKNEKEHFVMTLRAIQEEKEIAEKEVSRLTKLVKTSTKSAGDVSKQKKLEKELNESRASEEKLETQILVLSKQIEDFKNEKELFAKSLRDIQEEKEAAEREVARLTKLAKAAPSVSDVEGKRRLHNKLVLAEAGKERAVEEVIELSKKVEDNEAEKDLLTKTLRQVQKEKETAVFEVDRLTRAYVESEARNVILAQNLEESQHEAEQNKESFNFSVINANNLTKAYDELQEVMNAKIQDLQGEIEWITAEKSEVEADAAVLAKALKETGTDKEEAEEEVQRLSRAVVEAEAKIALLEREINLQKEANNSLQSNITDLSQAYKGLKQEYEWTNEQKEEVEEDAHVLASSLIKKEDKVKKLSDDNYEARKYVLALTKALSRAKNEIGAQNYENKEDLFEQQQQEEESNNIDAQSAYNEIQRSKELAQTYSNALDEALQELQKKSDENEQAKEEIRNLASKLGEADYKFQRLAKAYQKTQGIIQQQNEQLNSLSSAAEELEVEKSARIAAEQEVDKLNGELDQANDDIDTLNESLADTEIQRDKLKKSVKKLHRENKNEKRAAREAELQAENLAYNLAMKSASENSHVESNNDSNIEIPKESNNNENEEEAASDFVGQPMESNNFRLAGKKFGLTMTIDGKTYALTLSNPDEHFINQAGLKLDLAPANIENDVNQQFVFGKDAWNTVIDSVARKGMVWDVANSESWNPPNGTEFYLYPFHGRHNQHFIYKDNMIYAKQNGQVVTYVGYDFPFVMSEPTEALKENQTFNIQLI